MMKKNEFGQPIGEPVPDWNPALRPQRKNLSGLYCQLEPLDPLFHADQLFDAHVTAGEDRYWTYMGYGPFSDLKEYKDWLNTISHLDDPFFYAIVGKSIGKAIGVSSFLNVHPGFGSIEVGHIHYSPALQKTAAATEAMFLMMAYAFDDLGYRRYEWKCDALNQPSRQAAHRLGFSFEGVFRQHLMYKGRNRDTAWFSIIDREWPALKAAYQNWLDPQNFFESGQQRTSLVI